MADSMPYGERALILAPAQLSRLAFDLLDKAGIETLAAQTMDELGSALGQGAGLAIVADSALDGSTQSPLHQYIGQQPDWSDLPVVLLTGPSDSQHPPAQDTHSALGNLFLLPCPFDPGSLLALTQSSLRARRRQYQARSHGLALSGLQSRVEEQLRQLREDEQYLRQAQKMEAIGQLAGGVAHDFNNLLTGIGGSLELIGKRLQQGRFDALPTLLELSQQAVRRAASMTHSLLAFSSRQSLDAHTVQLPDLLHSERLTSLLGQHTTLTVECEPQLWPVQVDPLQLQEVVNNLLQNARDAMPNGGELTIRASNQHLDGTQFGGHALPAGDYVRLSIADNGCGMPQSTLDRAFDPFYTTKPIGQGTGLGLSMVYGFSKQSRGHVALFSQIGHGTRVDLYLPRPDEPQSPAGKPTPAPLVNKEPGGKVLIVEDDATVRILVQQALEEHGYPCVAVDTANAALALLRSDAAVMLLVSDVGLPGMNGRQLAEIARKLRPGLRVLFITGYAENALARGGFLDPGMQMISKPFAFSQLAAKVTQMLGKVSPP
ncbi:MULTISPECIES: ATP-binding protein [Pseudomonas]|uniref:ATP-binding protein n=1 Tax=Pseudomonas TaxID=286 RepID=UPI0003F8D642|nr:MULTISPECIES: ATP-binding protein [Pseudomonas]PRA60284.1 hybrid sensor histidine kinase/response regulator [Pseudomonas sp. MYb187]